MYKNIFISILFVIFIMLQPKVYSQEQKKFQYLKTGAQLNYGNRDNFYFENENYSLNIYNFKLQRFYKLKDLNKWSFNLVLQPQFQHIKHRLLNEAFIRPEDFQGNYLFYREKLSKLKSISLYAFELGFQLKRPIFKGINFEFTAGLGCGYIDYTTERLARGFTFTETLSAGFSKRIGVIELYTGFGLNHISNFNIQQPNSGYNTLNLDIGFRFFSSKSTTTEK